LFDAENHFANERWALSIKNLFSCQMRAKENFLVAAWLDLEWERKAAEKVEANVTVK
jgi:hypothetical protein